MQNRREAVAELEKLQAAYGSSPKRPKPQA
jgi:hypothetical protein